jgi:hypothetical protein
MMTLRAPRASGMTLAAALCAVLLTGTAPSAHHAIAAKFDDAKPLTISGVVTLVDWRNPHVHVYMNVRDAKDGVLNWAVEIESPIDLQQNGWARDSVQPGDALTVQGIAARNGSRQVWGRSIVQTPTGKRVLFITPSTPPEPLQARPTPRWPDKQPRLGPMAGGVQGYWAYPSATVLMEAGANVQMDGDGLLKNVADAARVAPMQPWALALYQTRQRRTLQDDPTFLNCKPPGGPRQFQLPYGIQFAEDRERQRIFVLIGGGNNNFRIMYLDGRSHAGQVGGDDDNPLYYGRSVAKWEGDTLAVDTRGFNEDFWFTNGGLPHTEQLKLLERFSRPTFDTLRYDVTIDDPGAYTRPWSTGWTLRWVSGQEMPRHLCQENRP